MHLLFVRTNSKYSKVNSYPGTNSNKYARTSSDSYKHTYTNSYKLTITWPNRYCYAHASRESALYSRREYLYSDRT